MDTDSIMIVEDDNYLRQSIALLLQRAGYLTSATDCVYKAMEMMKSGDYQMIIVDINTLEAGNLLLKRLQDIYSRLSIVILTDQLIPDLSKEYKPSRMHYLTKPVAPERLLDSVEDFLEKR